MSNNYRRTKSHNEAVKRGCHACKHYSFDVIYMVAAKLTYDHRCKGVIQVVPCNTCDKWEAKK